MRDVGWWFVWVAFHSPHLVRPSFFARNWMKRTHITHINPHAGSFRHQLPAWTGSVRAIGSQQVPFSDGVLVVAQPLPQLPVIDLLNASACSGYGEQGV